jgi:saccharopepsin
MKLSPLLLTLLPFVSANRIHKLKLHKVPSVATNAELESAYLAEKYGAPQYGQLPLLGSGGSGRRMKRPTMRHGEELLWTQEQINGGHSVPLTSKPHCASASDYHSSAT